MVHFRPPQDIEGRPWRWGKQIGLDAFSEKVHPASIDHREWIDQAMLHPFLHANHSRIGQDYWRRPVLIDISKLVYANVCHSHELHKRELK